jgi:hypothetical protein
MLYISESLSTTARDFRFFEGLQTKHVNTHKVNGPATYLVEGLVMCWFTRLYYESQTRNKARITFATTLTIQDPEPGFKFLTGGRGKHELERH